MGWRDRAVVVKPTASGGGWRSRAVPAQATQPPAVSGDEALGRGLAQGATLGFGDEATGAIQALGSTDLAPWPVRALRGVAQLSVGRPLGEEIGGAGREAVRKLRPAISSGGRPLLVSRQEIERDQYRRIRDAERAANAAAVEQRPIDYAVGNVIGGLPAALAVPGYGGAAAMGAVGGLGASEADLIEGDVAGAARDTAMGGALGLGGEALGRGIGKAVGAAAKPIAKSLRKFASGRSLTASGAMKGTRNELQNLGGLYNAGQFGLEEGVVKPFRGLERISEEYARVQDQAGKRIGQLLDQFQQARGVLDVHGLLPPRAGPPPLSGVALAEAIERELVAPLQGTPGARNLMDAYQVEADAFRKLGDKPMDFQKMAKQVRAYNDRGKYHATRPPESAKAARDVREVLRTEQDRYLIEVADAVENAAAGGGRPGAGGVGRLPGGGRPPGAAPVPPGAPRFGKPSHEWVEAVPRPGAPEAPPGLMAPGLPSGRRGPKLLGPGAPPALSPSAAPKQLGPGPQQEATRVIRKPRGGGRAQPPSPGATSAERGIPRGQQALPPGGEPPMAPPRGPGAGRYPPMKPGQVRALVQELRDQRQRYGLATKLGDAAFDRTAGWGANNVFGLPELLLASGGGVAGGVVGGDWGSVGKGALAGLGSKLLRTYGSSVAGPLAQAMAKRFERTGTGQALPFIGRVAGQAYTRQPDAERRKKRAEALKKKGAK